MEGEDISFYEASESSDFVSGSYSILEPRENLRKVAPEEIDVILIPATAYGCDGTRLGRGKGYYDRFCSTFSNICGTIKQKSRIGVVPHECFMGRIPCDPWDLKVDAVLTDKVFQVLPVLEKEIEER